MIQLGGAVDAGAVGFGAAQLRRSVEAGLGDAFARLPPARRLEIFVQPLAPAFAAEAGLAIAAEAGGGVEQVGRS